MYQAICEIDKDLPIIFNYTKQSISKKKKKEGEIRRYAYEQYQQ